ncbi:MAG: transglutaminase domain-containing protein, partial [Acutalibacteraceae bacterium]
GWQTISKKKYYFCSDGYAVSGLKTISGKKYYFDTKTYEMKTGWQTISKKKYYFCSDGYAVSGLKTISGKKYYFDSKTYEMKTGWQTINNNKYYFKKSGEAATGWYKIGDYYYYFGSSGVMRKNQIVGNYYVLNNGRRSTSAAVNGAVKVVNSVSKSSMSKEEKLKACYNWIIRNCSYERDYTNPANLKSGWTETYAKQLFSNHTGNCYRYASGMAYCAAVLGYKSKVAIGKISSSHGMTNHGWAEVTMNGKTYIYDPVQQDYYSGNYCKRTYDNYPKKLQKQKSYSIVLS